MLCITTSNFTSFKASLVNTVVATVVYSHVVTAAGAVFWRFYSMVHLLCLLAAVTYSNFSLVSAYYYIVVVICRYVSRWGRGQMIGCWVSYVYFFTRVALDFVNASWSFFYLWRYLTSSVPSHQVWKLPSISVCCANILRLYLIFILRMAMVPKTLPFLLRG